jgi:spermidine synthase
MQKSKKPSLQTFMVIAKKENSAVMQQVSPPFDRSTADCSGDQVRGLFEALDNENKIRTEHASGSDIIYSLEDLHVGAGGDLTEIQPGRRLMLTLGESGFSRFFYKSVLLDSPQTAESFLYSCGVFLVPKTRAHEWLFSSEEGQWTIVESSKAARLIMIFLDTTHADVSMDDIQKDLSPLVKNLAPEKNANGAQIPFMAASDGIKQRKIVHQVTSALTGPIIVDDVEYEQVDENLMKLFPSKELIFRRLTFERSEGLVQSEGLLTNEESFDISSTKDQKKIPKSKSKKKGSQRRNEPHTSLTDDSRNELEVNHDYLASSYHTGIISGFMLISSYLESVASERNMIKAIVIGLGAGLLPMHLHKCLPFLHIEVVELDPVVVDLAKDYFGFRENDHLKVHVTDGIKFVKEVANSDRVDILIIDVDSSDSSSGMTCPAVDFVEESFLLTAKDSLSDEGLFIVNLVSRSSAIKHSVISRMKEVFSNLYALELEEDVNEVIFAINASNDNDKDDQFSQASKRLENLLKLKNPERIQTFVDAAKKIKPL